MQNRTGCADLVSDRARYNSKAVYCCLSHGRPSLADGQTAAVCHVKAF